MYSLIQSVNIYWESTFCWAINHRCEQTDMLHLKGKLWWYQGYEGKNQETGRVIWQSGKLENGDSDGDTSSHDSFGAYYCVRPWGNAIRIVSLDPPSYPLIWVVMSLLPFKDKKNNNTWTSLLIAFVFSTITMLPMVILGQ